MTVTVDSVVRPINPGQDVPPCHRLEDDSCECDEQEQDANRTAADELLDLARVHDCGLVLDRYGPCCYDNDPEPGDSIVYRRLSPAEPRDFDASDPEAAVSEGRLFLSVPHASGSDYGGSTIDLANHREFRELFDGCPVLFETHGSHGTYGTLVRLGEPCCQSTEILDTVGGLMDYPVICDEKLSEVEDELSWETWESCYRADFSRALEDLDENLEPSDDAADELARQLMERTGIYWEAEGCGPAMHLDLTRLVAAVTDDDLDALQAVEG